MGCFVSTHSGTRFHITNAIASADILIATPTQHYKYHWTGLIGAQRRRRPSFCLLVACLGHPPLKAKQVPRSLNSRLPVALVVTPSPVAVLCPGRQAQPAELVAALRACHVHAALVLLNRPLALGACLRVGQDPVQIL